MLAALVSAAAAQAQTHGTGGFYPAIRATYATLPPHSAGQVIYCTDVLTSRGIGDLVFDDGANWWTSEKVIAATDMVSYIGNLWQAGKSFSSPINLCAITFDWANTSSTFTGTSQTGGGSANFASGTSSYYGNSVAGATGTSSGGKSSMYGNSIAYTQASFTNGTAAAQGCVCAINYQNSPTDKAYVLYGFQSTYDYTVPTTGACFVYDPANTLAFGVAGGAATNHWFAVTFNNSGTNITDTGLTTSTQVSAPDRLLVVLDSTGARYYTNGVLAASHSTYLPAGSIYLRKYILSKNAGSTTNFYFYMGGNIDFFRHPNNARTLP